MVPYTEDEVEQLLACKKIIIEGPRKEMHLMGKHFRDDLRLVSEDEKLDFSVFMRKHSEYQENFSVGLRYNPKDGRDSIVIIRLNGPHGEASGEIIDVDAHFVHHVHRAKEGNIKQGRRPERKGDPVTCYASYDQALACLLRVANITNAEAFFPDPAQFQLPFEE